MLTLLHSRVRIQLSLAEDYDFVRVFFLILRPPPSSTLFPYTTLFRSLIVDGYVQTGEPIGSRTLSRLLGQHLSPATGARSEEHTSELQSRLHLVCRLLLEKKKEPPPEPELTRHPAIDT